MSKLKNKIAVLIPDAETFAFPYVLNCMSHLNEIKLYVISTRKDFPLRYSRHVHRFIFYPEQSDVKDWINFINKVTVEQSIDVIMPIYETGIKIIIEHQTLLGPNINKLVPLPSLQDFITASNKALLAEHLTQIGISVPKTVPLSSNVLEDKANLNLNFPILAKPLKSGSGRGIVKFKDFDSFRAYFKEKGIGKSYILQEFIEGSDYGCNVICYKGDILAYTIQKGNLWNPSKPYSAQIGLDFIYDEKLYQTVKILMKSLNWNGVADLDLLYEEERDIFYIVEINPRFWATLTAALMAGINYPYLLILMTLGNEISPQKYKHIPYVSLKGLKQSLRKENTLLGKARFIWQSTPLKYRLDDPIPIAYEYYLKFKKSVISKLERWFSIQSNATQETE